MNVINQQVVDEFKLRIKLDGNEEDENLTRILLSSVNDLIMKVGPYTIEENPTFKELVFERSRYVYNDALEYFDTNFVSQLTHLAINMGSGIIDGGGNPSNPSDPTELTREQIVEILGYNPANENVISPLDVRVTNNANSINVLNTSVMNNTNMVNQFNVRLTTLNSTLDALATRVTDLENRPQVDLTPVNNRLTQIETINQNQNQRLDDLEANSGGSDVDLTPINNRLDSLDSVTLNLGNRLDNEASVVSNNVRRLNDLDLHVANNDIHKTSSVIRQEQNTPLRTEVVSSLPTSNLNTGRIVFDSSDNTFRGYNGGEWV